jgi:ankyrin repeat protein
MTPLHEAVASDAAVPEVIRIMIDVIVKANNWSLVDAVDTTGNTALHIAARRGRPEIIPELAKLNAHARNQDGDTPFHVSARAGHPYSVETMLQVFNRPEKGFNVDDVTRNDGQSAVHLCAARGDWQRVEQLVAAGANLALQDVRGNTPLHVVVEESLKEPAMIESFLQVSRIIQMIFQVWAKIVDRNSSAIFHVSPKMC